MGLADKLRKLEYTGPSMEWLHARLELTAQGEWWMARCPAHDDRDPSLGIREREGKHPYIECFSGCRWTDIIKALGWNEGEADEPTTDEFWSDIIVEIAPRLTVVRDAVEQAHAEEAVEARSPLEWLALYTKTPLEYVQRLGLGESGAYVTFPFPEVGFTKYRKAGPKRKHASKEDEAKDPHFKWVQDAFAITENPPQVWPEFPDKVSQYVYLCEGESDAIVMRHAGYEAYAVLGGAGKAPEHAIWNLAKRRGAEVVYIMFDVDKAGRDGSYKQADALRDCGMAPVILSLEDLVDYQKGEKDLRHAWLKDPDVSRFRDKIDELIAPYKDAAPSAQFYTLASLADTGDLEPDWHLEGYIARGSRNALTGRGGGGKTTWLFNWFKMASVGGPFMDAYQKPMSLLYLTEETDQSLKKKLSIYQPIKNVTVWKRDDAFMSGLSWKGICETACRKALELDIEFVVIDSFGQWSLIEDMNDGAKMTAAFNELRILTANGIGYLLIHHERKAGGEHGDQVLGSGQFIANCDMLMSLNYTSEANVRTLKVMRNRANPDHEAHELALLRQDDGMLVTTTVEKKAGARDRVIQALEATGEWMTMKALAGATEMTPRYLRDQMKTLIAEKVVHERIDDNDRNTRLYRLSATYEYVSEHAGL